MQKQVFIEQIEQKFLSLGLLVDSNVLDAYVSRCSNLRYACSKIKTEISNVVYIGITSKQFLELRLLVEYITVMTIGAADILAVLFYNSFKLSGNGYNIYFTNISEKLKLCDNMLARQLADKIEILIGSSEWKYVQALNNHIKHNSILKHSVDVSFERPRNDFIHHNIEAFNYKKSSYPSITVEQFLDKCDYLILELNEILQSILKYQ